MARRYPVRAHPRLTPRGRVVGVVQHQRYSHGGPKIDTRGALMLWGTPPSEAENPLARMTYAELIRMYRDARGRWANWRSPWSWGQLYQPPRMWKGPGMVRYNGQFQSQEYADFAGNERLRMRAIAAELRRRGRNLPRGF